MRIDVHAHMTPETCVAITPDDREGETYTLHFTDEQTGDVLYTAQQRASNFEPEEMYSAKRRLRDMDTRGIDMHALSVPTSILFYQMDSDKALGITRRGLVRIIARLGVGGAKEKTGETTDRTGPLRASDEE